MMLFDNYSHKLLSYGIDVESDEGIKEISCNKAVIKLNNGLQWLIEVNSRNKMGSHFLIIEANHIDGKNTLWEKIQGYDSGRKVSEILPQTASYVFDRLFGIEPKTETRSYTPASKQNLGSLLVNL